MYSAAALALLERASTELVCVDAGSAGGVHPRMNAIRGRARLIGLDADHDECARLNAAAGPGERHLHAAVGRHGEHVVLELHKKRQTSSCFETDVRRVSRFRDPGRYGADGDLPMSTRSLDDICAVEDIPRIDFLKVDVEGLELAVLEGFSGPLLAAEVEVSFHPFRKNAPLFDEIMKHMRDRGFMLLDLRRTYWTPTSVTAVHNHRGKGLLMFGDALFLVDPFLERNHALLGTPDARARYLALLCLYGYAPEALMAVDVLTESGVMPREEGTTASRLIERHSSRSLPAGPWLPVRRLMVLVERLVKWPTAVRSGLALTDFYQGDGPLGN